MANSNHPVTYSHKVAAALNQKLASSGVRAKVGMRQQDSLLYVALEAVVDDRTTDPTDIHSAQPLVSQLQQALKQLRRDLSLGWVRLVKVSGRLPDQPEPLWKEDLLLTATEPPIARALTRPNATLKAPNGDVNINIGGNLSGQLIVGDGNQLHSYTYNVEHGGVLNVAAPPVVQPRSTPLSLKPKPFAHLLDRQTVLPIIQETLKQALPVEVYAKAGFGKTTLMRHLAHQDAIAHNFPDGIVYLSAARQPAVDLLQSLYDVFYEAVPAFKPSYGQVQQALKEKQTLIILNKLGLDKEELEWLSAALPQSTFVLVTTERVYWQEGAAIALEGLPLVDAIALLQKDLNRPLTTPEQTAAAALWKSLSGNPLQLRRAASQVQTSGQSLAEWFAATQALQRQVAADSPEVGHTQLRVGPNISTASLKQAITQKATSSLSANHKKLLALMGAMGGIALSTQEALAISQVPETAEVLSELANLQLIEATSSSGYQLCADLVEALPTGPSTGLDPQPWLQSATNYFAYGAESAAGTQAAANSEAMMHLLEWTQRTGQWQQSLGLARQLDVTLSVGGQWQQWQQVLTHSLQAAQHLGDGGAEAWALHQLGTGAIATGNLAQAQSWLSRAITLREQLQDVAGAAVSRHNLGLIVPPLVAGNGAVPTAIGHSTRWWARPAGWLTAGLLIAGVVGGVVWNSNRTNSPPTQETSTDLDDEDTATVLPAGPEDEPEKLPKVDFDVEALSFGEVATGEIAEATLTVSNSGEVPLVIQSLLATEGDFVVLEEPCTTEAVMPAQSCTVSVLFEPRRIGDRTARLILKSNAQNPPAFTLSGTGTRSVAETPEPTPTQDPEEPNPIDEPTADSSNVPDPADVEDVIPEPDDESTTDETAPEEPITDDTEPPEPVNQPPLVSDVLIELESGEPYVFDLLAQSQAYDLDPGDTVVLSDITNIDDLGGRLERNSDGTVTYYHPKEQTQENIYSSYTNSFNFTVVDSQGAQATGKVTIRVSVPQPSSDLPISSPVF
ncbi:MAG: choice-of-anchor D domain-containing protein [Cyanobacteria bacterium J06648_10]